MGIYQHFREEEHAFIDQVLSWKTEIERTFVHKLTDFLDPREQQIIKSVIGATNDLSIRFYGGGEYSERKRAVIAPFYEEVTENSFQLTIVQAAYHSKFVTLTHPDVMGAFLSLGLKRGTLGDIFVNDGIVQIIMSKEIAPYVLTNLTAIKNTNIKLVEIPFSSVLESRPNWIKSNQIVSSLRLDTVLKEIYNVSRKTATDFITKNLVKVNFKTVTDRAFSLYEGDLISVRTKGRSKLISVNGQTRKKNLNITIARLK